MVKINDEVRIKQARTSGGKVYDIRVTKIISKNKVSGIITGYHVSAGFTVTGNIIKK